MRIVDTRIKGTMSLVCTEYGLTGFQGTPLNAGPQNSPSNSRSALLCIRAITVPNPHTPIGWPAETKFGVESVSTSSLIQTSKLAPAADPQWALLHPTRVTWDTPGKKDLKADVSSWCSSPICRWHIHLATLLCFWVWWGQVFRYHPSHSSAVSGLDWYVSQCLPLNSQSGISLSWLRRFNECFNVANF